MGLVTPILANQSWSFVNIHRAIYEQSTATLFLVTLFLVSPCIVNAHRTGVTAWYKTRNQTAFAFVGGRFLYYLVTILLPLLILYWVVSVFLRIYFQMALNIFPLSILLVSVIVFNLSLQMFISEIAKNSAFAIMTCFMLWLALSIGNMFAPIARGFLAPYDINSIQHDHFEAIMLGELSFGFDFMLAICLPIVYAALLLGLSIQAVKRKTLFL